METDRDPAPVCRFSLRGQAWLPERKKLKQDVSCVGSQT